jgi:hypothetical protein
MILRFTFGIHLPEILRFIYKRKLRLARILHNVQGLLKGWNSLLVCPEPLLTCLPVGRLKI